MKLIEQHCQPVKAGDVPLSADKVNELKREIPQWMMKDKQIEREFTFKDFREAMTFVNKEADLAEEQGHHPDLCIYYNRVHLAFYTHKIGGLSQNDFIMAAKTDLLVSQQARVGG